MTPGKKKRKDRKGKKPIKGGVRPAPHAIKADLKALTLAAEPQIDHNPTHLDTTFRTKLDDALAQLSSQDTPFRFVEVCSAKNPSDVSKLFACS